MSGNYRLYRRTIPSVLSGESGHVVLPQRSLNALRAVGGLTQRLSGLGLINEGEVTICIEFRRANWFLTAIREQTGTENVSVSLKFSLCLVTTTAHIKDNGVTCYMSTASFHYLDWGQSITGLTEPTGLYICFGFTIQPLLLFSLIESLLKASIRTDCGQ